MVFWILDNPCALRGFAELRMELGDFHCAMHRKRSVLPRVPHTHLQCIAQLTAEEIERLKPFDFTTGGGGGFGGGFNRESGGKF